jgi:hypothetical protein
VIPAEKSIKSAKNTFPGADQFEDLIREKADHLGITTKETEKRLREGSATLMSLVLATKVGWEAFSAWRTDETAEPAIRTFETGGLGGGGGA